MASGPGSLSRWCFCFVYLNYFRLVAKIVGSCDVYLYYFMSFDVAFLTSHLILEFEESSLFPDRQGTPTTWVFIKASWTCLCVSVSKSECNFLHVQNLLTFLRIWKEWYVFERKEKNWLEFCSSQLMHWVTPLSDYKFRAHFSFFSNFSSYAYISSTVVYGV